MKKTTTLGTRPWFALAATLALGAAAGVANAQPQGLTPPPPPPNLLLEQPIGGGASVTMVGEVTAVDAAARTLTVKGPEGQSVTLPAGPEVRNFDQVKVGDRLRVDYQVGVALALMKGGDGIREKVETEAAAVARRGAKPGVVDVQRTVVVANVEQVDRANQIVRLKGVERTMDVRVSDASLLQDLKVGDQVVASVTESLAISVRPAPAN